MRVALTVALIATLMLLSATANAQRVDTGSMLGLELSKLQPTFYTDDEGYTVVVGEIHNRKEFPVTDVRVLVNFYTDESDESPHEFQVGGTILDVIPAFGTSQYMIRSSSQDLDIFGVTAHLLGFTSSFAKHAQLKLGNVGAWASDTLVIDGTVTNNAQNDVENVTVYALVYNALEPPRLIVIESADIGPLSSTDAFDFQFTLQNDDKASFVKLIAESASYVSDSVDTPIIRPLVIQDIKTVDANRNPVSLLQKDVPVYIQSRITGQNIIELDYTYIVQIKRAQALPVVEHIGTMDGKLTDSGVSVSLVEWTPETSGFFFVEAYVWNTADTPLSSPLVLPLLHVE